jgi:hypothetical protein
MKKLFCIILFFLLCSTHVCYALTVQRGDTIYLSSDRIVNLVCDIVDTGVGMDQGLAKFRIHYVDDTYEDWTAEQTYAQNVELTLNVLGGKTFTIQGLFADSLGNWSTIPVETGSLVVDDSSPSGTITVRIDIHINVQ